MWITREIFDETIKDLAKQQYLSLDTETTGLRPYHGDRIISIIIGNPQKQFYFNFYPYSGMEESNILTADYFDKMQQDLFSSRKINWYLHNAKFDLHMLGVHGCTLAGKIFCTKALGRIYFNDHQEYSLEASAKREGYEKSKEVDIYIQKNKLWEKVEVPGKNKSDKRLHFYKVPPEIIYKYGLKDAEITYALGSILQYKFMQMPASKIYHKMNSDIPRITEVVKREQDLLKVVFHMEQYGILIDKDYCKKAIEHETTRMLKAKDDFYVETGKTFKTSPVLFAEVFKDQQDKWKYTETGRPSFTADVLDTFEGSVAKAVNTYRDAKARSDFLQGFLYYSDANSVVHPSLNQDGTHTGRFASSSPNLQNLKNTGEEGGVIEEFPIRSAVIARPGFHLVGIDYQALEFRLMLHYAKQMDLIEKVKQGLDLHQATADAMGITRKEAKTMNFGLLYGMGASKMAQALKCSEEEARAKRELYFRKLPAVKTFIQNVTDAAKRRGYIVNALGRVTYLPDPNFAYKACNYLIQGLGADIVKEAMVRIYSELEGCKSKMILTVHDELIFEVHESELGIEQKFKRIMDSVLLGPLPIISEITYYDGRWGVEKNG